MAERSLYKIGEMTAGCYLISGGKATIEVQHGSPLVLEDSTLLAGSLEYLLAPEESKIPQRMTGLSVSADTKVKELTFETLEDLLIKYDTGFAANRFLALLIEHTNKSFIQQHRSLPKTWKDYEDVAMELATLVRGLSRASAVTRVSEIERILKLHQDTEVCIDGELLLREQTLGKFQVGASTMVRYLARFDKDSYLCRQGDSANGVYILLEGSVGVLVRGKYVAKITQPGEAFGELSLFLSSRRTADLVAETPAAVYRVTQRDLPEFQEKHPWALHTIARTLASRVEGNIGKLKLLSRYSGERGEPSKELKRKLDQAQHELSSLRKQIAALKKMAHIPELSHFLR